ncbi:unnamed protein product [Allacma fusca]|uniref:Uncharacterized protein n=1 Tax=Allacma fusca TaxID=39272 RepID=A0A8J2JLW8_9HEXA|nr:unnamed protein product [Allacma fusca]
MLSLPRFASVFLISYGVFPQTFHNKLRNRYFTGKAFAFLITRCCAKRHQDKSFRVLKTFLTKKAVVYVYAFPCVSTEMCLTELKHIYATVVQDGKAIIWDPKITMDNVTSLSVYSKQIDLFEKNVSRHSFANAVEYFLMQGLNITAISEKQKLMKNTCPFIFKSVLDSFQSSYIGDLTVVSTGRSLPFKFFTPDGIYVAKESLQLFSNPLKSSVWFGILGICCICSLVFSRKDYREFTSATIWASNTYQFLGVLVEQSHVKALGYHQRAIFGTWLLACLIFLNSYRAVLKTEVNVGRIDSKWEYLDQIVSFNAVVILQKSVCNHYSQRFDSLYSAKETIEEIWSELKDFKKFHVFDFYKSLQWIEVQTGKLISSMQYNEAFGGSVKQREYLTNLAAKGALFGKWGRERLYLICESKIQNFVNNANSTEYAFVARSDDVAFYQETLKQVEGLKVGDNLKVDDGYLTFSNIFGMSSNMRTEHHRCVSGRMKMLMESGIYWFWEKLEGIRFPKYKMVSKKENLEKPLSFSGSCMQLVFYCFLVSMVVHTTVFVLECIVNSVKLRMLALGVVYMKIVKTFILKFPIL